MSILKYLKISIYLVLVFMILLIGNCTYANEKKYNDRIQEISEVIRNAKLNNQKVDYPRLYIERGQCYDYVDDYDNAMMDYNRVIQMDNVPKYLLAMAYYGRAHIYDMNMEYDKVIENLNQAIKFNPKFHNAYAQRAVAYEELKDYKHALSDINTAININGDKNKETARYYAIRAGINEKVKDYDGQIADYSKAISIDSNGDVYYMLRGSAYYWAKKDFAKALNDTTKRIELLEKKNEVGYNIEQAYSWRAYLYIKQKKYDNAINDYTQALKYTDKTSNYNVFYVDYLIRRECLYAILNDNKKAIDDFEMAEIKASKSSLYRIYFSKALYYYNLGDNAKTLEYLRKSMKADKSFDKANKMYDSIMQNKTSGVITFESFLADL